MKDFYPEDEITLPENSGIANPVEVAEDLSLEELFQTAMDSEKESEEFYNTLRERFEDTEAKRTLGFLAASEREHYEILKEELKKIN
jgi:rubrerythrin